jgi:hypothetical protein
MPFVYPPRQCQFVALAMQRFGVDGRSRRFRLGVIAENTRRPLRQSVFPLLNPIGVRASCWDSSTIVCSPPDSGKRTFAAKAGLWFRRGRLVMVSSVSGIYAKVRQNSTDIKSR